MKCCYGFKDVDILTIGPESKAVEVIFEGNNIRLAENQRNAFDIAFGKLEVNNVINCYPCGEGANQGFTLNLDKTISSLSNPNLVLGFNDEGTLVLVEKNSHQKCIFKIDDQDLNDITQTNQQKNFNQINKYIPGKKSFHFVTTDGRGFKLENKDVDATQGHRAFFLKPCSPDEAIEVMFTDLNALKVVDGHHTLGQTLNNWQRKSNEVNRHFFSTWDEKYQPWQMNSDMTLAPQGENNLVLGWTTHMQLVKRDSFYRLCFRGYWTMQNNKDMCGQGDVDIVHDWRNNTDLAALKKIVIEKGYSAVTVGMGENSLGKRVLDRSTDFRTIDNAALKQFDYQLEESHLKPINDCCKLPCNIHIFTKNHVTQNKPTTIKNANNLDIKNKLQLSNNNKNHIIINDSSTNDQDDNLNGILSIFKNNDKELLIKDVDQDMNNNPNIQNNNDTYTSEIGGELGKLINGANKQKLVFLTFFNNKEDIERFKDLQLVEKIGEGGEGTVQRSNEIQGITYAVKVFKLDTSDEDLLKSRVNELMKEFFTFKSINHPYLVNQYYLEVPEVVSDIQMNVKLVMKQIKGVTLSHLIKQLNSRNASLKEQQIIKISKCLLLALKHLHNLNIVHRDLKPSNIIIDEQFNAYLTDYGISKHLSIITQINVVHTNVGTPLYISPDVINNNCYQKTDVQSFGVVMLEMYTGKRPQYGVSNQQNVQDMVMQGITQWNYFIENYLIDLSPQIYELCSKCMQYDANMRPSVDELLSMNIFCEEYNQSVQDDLIDLQLQ